MTMTVSPQEQAWVQAERETVAVMGTINAAVARLVRTIRMLIDTEGWGGTGIRSVEHWVSWKAAMSSRRAANLALIARRIHELPRCFALFEAGRLTEDAMVRIAGRVPAAHDEVVAAQAPTLLISQLARALAALPPLGEPEPDRSEQQYRRRFDTWTEDGGWLGGRFCLPPDEGAVLRNGLAAARDAEFRDRQGLEPDAPLDDVGEHARRSTVSQADALVRMASEASDSLDTDLARTGRRGDRNKIVLHHEVDPGGRFGPGQLHLGPVVPDVISRYLACDAEVMVASYRMGQLIGIHPSDRTVSRALRRAIERRDQGCTHPLCTQRRFLPSTCTTCATGKTAARPCLGTLRASVPGITGSTTTASSPSRATPNATGCGSSTAGGDRSNHPAPARRIPCGSTSRAPSSHRSESACRATGSPGTDRARTGGSSTESSCRHDANATRRAMDPRAHIAGSG